MFFISARAKSDIDVLMMEIWLSVQYTKIPQLMIQTDRKLLLVYSSKRTQKNLRTLKEHPGTLLAQRTFCMVARETKYMACMGCVRGCVRKVRKRERQGRIEQVMLSDSMCKMCMGRVGGCVREVREREDGADNAI